MFSKIAISILLSICIIFSAIMLSGMTYNTPTKVNYSDLSPTAKKEVECLADNIFFEAAYEPKEGQEAVAFVTLNRVNSGQYPDTVCNVVKQKVKHTCQFSWYCESKQKRLSSTKDLTDSQKTVYNEILQLALDVYVNYEHKDDPSNGALFYHADYVNPKWKNMIHTATIGHHIFYNRKDML